jgi:2-methylaconitate cis-trans-isomerase PrpF
MSIWDITYPLPSGDVFPLGVATADAPIPVTLVVEPTAYVIAAAPLGDVDDDELERLRCNIARRAGISITETVPKLALVSTTTGGGVAFRTRKFAPHAAAPGESCWHHGIATTGLLALAIALDVAGSIPRALVGRTLPAVVSVATPAGPKSLAYIVGPDGKPAVRLNLGNVTIEDRVA